MLCNVYCTLYSMLCVRNTRKHFTKRYVYLTSIGAGGFLGKHLFSYMYEYGTPYTVHTMYNCTCTAHCELSIQKSEYYSISRDFTVLFPCMAVHAIFSLWSYTHFFLYLFLGIPSCLGKANKQKEKSKARDRGGKKIIT